MIFYMDEDKIPKKGILEDSATKKTLPFNIPQKKPIPSVSEGIVFDVPKKEQASQEIKISDIPQKSKEELADVIKTAHLPEQNKVLEPTIDINEITPIEKPKEPGAKIDYIPQKTVDATQIIATKKISVDSKKNEEEQKTEAKVGQSDIPTLRTYKKDVAGAITDQKTSLVRMVLEEQKVKYKKEEQTSPKTRKNMTLIIFSILFALLTAGVVYYTFFIPSKGEQLLTEIRIVPLISVETLQEVPIDGKNEKVLAKEIQEEITTATPKLDTIKDLFFTKTFPIKTDSGLIQKKNLVGASELFNKLQIPVPQIILRTIKDDFMFGYHAFEGNQPFLILKTDYYDNAFVGMLGWEGTVAEDLKPLFGTIGKGELGQRTWGDLVTNNKDTRVLYNSDKSIALVYMFKDQKTLIITTNNNTLFEISRRLDVELKKK